MGLQSSKTLGFFQSLLLLRTLQTRGFKRNIKVRTNKPVTGYISKTPSPPNLYEGPTLTLSDGSNFTCINTLQLSLKTPLLKELMPESVSQLLSIDMLPPLTRKPKQFPPFRVLSEEESTRLFSLRQEDPEKYSVLECSRMFNIPPFQVMQTVHAPIAYKKMLAERLNTTKYRRRQVLRARRKEVFEDAWHHYHS